MGRSSRVESFDGSAIKDDFEALGSQSSMSQSAIRRHKSRQKSMMYANDTIFAKIAYNPVFEQFTIFVIVLNAIWLGIDTDLNHSSMKDKDDKLPLQPYSDVVENVFCVYFFVEVVIRFLSFRQKYHCLFDGWFVFDSILVTMMVIETWIMKIVEAAIGDEGSGAGILANFSVFRLMRLLRLTRMARLMRSFPEMLTLVKGMVRAAKAVIWILLFMFLILYVFGILFTAQMVDVPRTRPGGYLDSLEATTIGKMQMSGSISSLVPLFKNPNEAEDPCAEDDTLAGDLFFSLGDSMMNLFTRGILGDNLQETCDAIKAESDIMQWMFFVFFGLTFALLLNMLIGVLCEVVSQAGEEERGELALTELKLSIREAFHKIDSNNDKVVCKEEWMNIREQPAVRQSMVGIGMEEERLDELIGKMSGLLFGDGGEAVAFASVDEERPESSDSAPRGSFWSTEAAQSVAIEPEPFGERSIQGRASQTRMARTADGRLGFNVDTLVEKVLDLRPDQDASALDLQILRAKVFADQTSFQKRLDRIEARVREALGPRYAHEDFRPPPEPASVGSVAPSSFGSTGAAEWRASTVEPMRGESRVVQADDLRQAARAPATALQAVSTDALFRELERRTAPRQGFPRTPTNATVS